MSRPSAGAPTLPLWPDEVDVELPLDDATEARDLAAYAYELEQEREQLRRALVDVMAHVEAGTPAPGNRVRVWRELAGTAYVDGLEPLERRDDGIARAAAKWTEAEAAAVDEAIATIAAARKAEARTSYASSHFEMLERHTLRSDKLLELTTADVWQELGDSFPVTKGIAGRMLAAKGAGIIANTGRTIIAPREATGPNHGQRLTVWRAL